MSQEYCFESNVSSDNNQPGASAGEQARLFGTGLPTSLFTNPSTRNVQQAKRASQTVLEKGLVEYHSDLREHITKIRWIQLYGFQGMVPFIHGDIAALSTAIKQLLSLRPDESSEFMFVQYDRKSSQPVLEIRDSVPLAPTARVWLFLEHLFDPEDETEYAFFVRRLNEPTPLVWEPAEIQYDLDVCRIYEDPHEDELKPASRRAYAYVAFPKLKEREFSVGPSYMPLAKWDANQYAPYMRAAMEVLTGRLRGDCQRAWFRLRFSTRHGRDRLAPISYGGLTMQPSEIHSLWPLQTAHDRESATLLTKPIAEKKVVFMLPNHRRTHQWGPVANTEKSYHRNCPCKLVWSLVHHFIGNERVQDLDHVRVIAGANAFGFEDHRSTPSALGQYCVPAEPSKGSHVREAFEEYLARVIREMKEPFLLIHPVWRTEATAMYFRGSIREDLGVALPAAQIPFVNLPPLDSRLIDFQISLNSLLETVYFGQFPYDMTLDTFSITPTPCFGDEGTSREAGPWPTYYFGPCTTQREWFGIRARLTTPFACVDVVGMERLDWRSSICQCVLWGPRYGAMAGYQQDSSEQHSFSDLTYAEPRMGTQIVCPSEECLYNLLHSKPYMSFDHAQLVVAESPDSMPNCQPEAPESATEHLEPQEATLTRRLSNSQRQWQPNSLDSLTSGVTNVEYSATALGVEEVNTDDASQNPDDNTLELESGDPERKERVEPCSDTFKSISQILCPRCHHRDPSWQQNQAGQDVKVSDSAVQENDLVHKPYIPPEICRCPPIGLTKSVNFDSRVNENSVANAQESIQADSFIASPVQPLPSVGKECASPQGSDPNDKPCEAVRDVFSPLLLEQNGRSSEDADDEQEDELESCELQTSSSCSRDPVQSTSNNHEHRPSQPPTDNASPEHKPPQRKRKIPESSYRYQSEDESADEHLSDADDLHKIKRRRVLNPTFRPPQISQGSSGE